MATTILTFHFSVLRLFSVWYLEHWSSGIKFIYRIYSIIMFGSLISLNIFQLAKLFFDKWDSFGEFNNSFSYNIAMQVAIVKAGTYLFKRDKVDRLIGMFEEDCCQVRDEFERNIRKTHEDRCTKIAKIGFFCLEFLTFSFVTTPLAFDIELRILPYPVLLPYSLSNLLVYWLTYASHVINCMYLAHVSITADFIATALMWHLCGQLEILKHRLVKVGGNITQYGAVSLKRQLLKECVQHHVHLYNIADVIYDVLGVYIVFQFYVDALAVGMSVYQLTTMSAGIVEKFAFFVYVSVMLLRLYLMCYFGNEVFVQSESLGDAIFQLDWTPLPREIKKNLLIMTLRSSKPIVVSSRVFVSLMLETFIKVVKVSYSGYNLLMSSVH